MLKHLVVILMIVALPKLGAEDIRSMTEEERFEELRKLDWKEPGTHQLPVSHSTLVVPSERYAIFGQEANRARMLLGALSDDSLEALIYHETLDGTVILQSVLDGYVSIDDWEDIDAEALLSSTMEGTEEANKERAKYGGDQIQVIGWLQKPVLDREAHIVYWAMEGKCEDYVFANSVALKLGREGYVRFTWSVSKEEFVPFAGDLEVMLRAHSYDEGYGYGEYTVGDKIANYGVAALVAASVGGKLLKTGGILLFLQKFAGFIFAALAAFFYKVRNFFKPASA